VFEDAIKKETAAGGTVAISGLGVITCNIII
jgi:hypothetical protein